ncbi:MAG: high-potential iron-sulfur protein [Parachlamydiales bacterium]
MKIPSLRRRSVLKGLAFLPALSVMGSLIFEIAKAAVEIPKNYYLATTADPLPKGMQYVDDAKKAATRRDANATCASCTQYAKTVKEFAHPADGKVATCEVFPKDSYKMHVKANGWCLAYQKKT